MGEICILMGHRHQLTTHLGPLDASSDSSVAAGRKVDQLGTP